MEDIKINVTKDLLALLENELKKCFQKLYERTQKRVTSGGDYFEEY
jgi:hypothetical protein